MTDNKRPSLIRQVAPAAVLTAAGVGFVSLLDNPTGTNTVSLGADGGAQTMPDVATTLAPSPATTVVTPPIQAPTVDAAGACDGDLVTSPTALFRWGSIQLQVHFTKTNAICDVEVLQYPNDRSKSISINERALPVYNQEAVAANSARISAMSGATDSWEAYTAALQAVIDSRS